jgi:hypothetical protein
MAAPYGMGGKCAVRIGGRDGSLLSVAKLQRGPRGRKGNA